MPSITHNSSIKVLFATSEAYPLVKTGGLADVSSGLPFALSKLGVDVKVIMPAYSQAVKNANALTVIKEYTNEHPYRILEGQLEPPHTTKIWLIDIPQYFSRNGGPYTTEEGDDWPDNAERFSAFCRAATAIALNQLDIQWMPDIVHCNDWQTGLIPALLAEKTPRPKTVFTIHNMAYQGNFEQAIFQQLRLPDALWSMEAMEFYGKFSFLKGGLVFADTLNTVSPTYAEEICTPQFGYGLDGLLNHRRHRLSGILNGVDYARWNPQTDQRLVANYQASCTADKVKNKTALQQRFQLTEDVHMPLVGIISRIVHQKGFELLLESLANLLRQPLQLIILGSGDKQFELDLQKAANQYPSQMAIQLGYDEALAHLIIGGSDIFLMPSLFEPCGLTQIYSLRYGTVPVVHHTGGLADSIVNTNNETLKRSQATGFHFYKPSPKALVKAVNRAIKHYKQPNLWQSIVQSGMQKDFSWEVSAKQYLMLYHTLGS